MKESVDDERPEESEAPDITSVKEVARLARLDANGPIKRWEVGRRIVGRNGFGQIGAVFTVMSDTAVSPFDRTGDQLTWIPSSSQ